MGSFYYFDGERGYNTQDWKYEHHYICAIELEWFSHSQCQSYYEWDYNTDVNCLIQKNLLKLFEAFLASTRTFLTLLVLGFWCTLVLGVGTLYQQILKPLLQLRFLAKSNQIKPDT